MKGPKNHRNAAFPVVQEYFSRMTLAKLGYFTHTSELSWAKSEKFQEIASQLEKLKSDEHKKAARKGRKG